jgi:NitT/TauT family transport system permease protein
MTRRTSTALRGAVGAVAFFAVLELVTRLQIVNPAFLPPASSILRTAFDLLGQSHFLSDILSTLRSWIIGLALATAVGVPVGVLLGASELSYRLVRPLIELLRPMPSVVLIPLAILVWGGGLEMEVIIVAYGCIWPILFNTIYGVHDLDPVARDTARSFGFSRAKVLARVAVPSAAAPIITGIRLASTFALVLAVTVELVTPSVGGLGSYIALAQSSGTRPELVYASTVIAGFVGLVINLGGSAVERRLIGWSVRDPGREGGAS